MIEQKRQTAHKCTIRDINEGRFVIQDGMNPHYVIAKDGRKLSRIHILATIVNRYVSDDRKYGFLVLDDSTSMIRAKSFQDTKIIEHTKKGDLIDIFGRVRQYNNETHISPEIIKVIKDPNYETLRKIELVKLNQEQKSKHEAVFEVAKKASDVTDMKPETDRGTVTIADVEQVVEAEKEKETKDEEKSKEPDMRATKNMVLKSLEELDTGDGVEYTRIIEAVGLPENVTESALDELLSEGSCYEPRPGRIKAL